MKKSIVCVAIAATLLSAGSDAAFAQLFDVGGHRLHAVRSGSGPGPTIVLEAGLGNDLTTWDPVVARLAELAPVVAYSRGGYGESEPGTLPRSTEKLVAELDALLTASGAEAPYVLVGHSWGGVIARAYAIAFPDKVAGLVMVDASHEQQFIRFRAADSVRMDQQRASQRTRIAENPNATGPLAEMAEVVALTDRGTMPSGSALPDVPVAILTSTQTGPNSTPEARRIWRAMHAEWAAQVTQSLHISTARSGHYVHRDEPELFLTAVRWVVEAARAR